MQSLARLGKTDRAKNLLEQNLTLDSGFDHPLTTIALLELATIAASKGQIDEVEIRSGQASLLAARLNQIDLLAESLPMLTEAADTLKPGEGLKIAEAVLRWVDADSASLSHDNRNGLPICRSRSQHSSV